MTVFLYTHQLGGNEPVLSSWVEDVWYSDESEKLLLLTKDQRSYIYSDVPAARYNGLVENVTRGASVGAVMERIIKDYGPGDSGSSYKVKPHSHSGAGPVAPNKMFTEPHESEALPQAFGTVIHYILEGKSVKMTSDKPAEEALREYLQAAEAAERLGVKVELK